jgi:hypothetical protein
VVRFNENMEEDDQLHQEEEAAEVIRQHQEELLEQAAQEEAIRWPQEEDTANQKPYHPPIRFSPKAKGHFRVSNIAVDVIALASPADDAIIPPCSPSDGGLG